MTAQIASAAQEQTHVSEDISRNVTEISTLSDTTAQQAETVESLSREVISVNDQFSALL
jgi:methyl-accepting chemotaxis protein